MKAALLYNKDDIRIKEIKVPDINSNEILLKIKSASICGTDVRMFRNGYKNINEENPLVLGHELSGIIEKVGASVTGFKEGMRIAVAPNMGCGQCDWCVSGSTHLCEEYKAFGININGGFAEYTKIPEPAIRQGNIMELPAHVSFDEAALAEPLACVYNAFERAAIRLGDDVLILGAGPIGLMHALMAKKGGAAKVIIGDVGEERLNHAAEMDSSYICCHINELKEKIKQLTNGRGVDVCITANPVPASQIMALELMAINGRVIYFGGLPANSDLSGINTNLIHYKQLIVSGTTRQSVMQFRKVLKLIADKVFDVQNLITDKYEVGNIEEAMQNIIKGKGIKHSIIFE
jgi:L-iditol 2-dehydrogenase